MPTYQYACTECDHAFEQVQSFSEASLTVCSKCDGRLRKIFNAVGVVFKGSGFYRTDSRKEARTSQAQAAEASSGESKSGESTSSDPKSSDPKSSEPKSSEPVSKAPKPKAEAGAA